MATNNNLIPINIKDLPKLDILSNSDLIPIETVEGTATILYRDFIIDEAHTTFAATLSASVTSAVNLSAAIDTTNATVKTVSASLYSSITALSSSSFAYSNALSSSIVSLNAAVTALSANVNILSSAVDINTTNIATLSSNVQIISAAVISLTSTGLSSRGLVIGSNTPIHYILGSDRPASLAAADDNFFDPAVANITLLPNKKYTLEFNIYYLKTTAGTMTFTLSGTQTFANGVGRYTTTPVAGMQTAGNVTGAGVLNATGTDIELPVTGSLTTAVNHNAFILFTIESGSNTSIVKLVAAASAGTYTPKRGSMFKLVQID